MSTPGSAALARLAEAQREIFSRRPEHAIEPSLDRIRALAKLLGDPQHACPVIHVTGTNGKTSTARMTEALLRARGLRTGLFTSPHLSSVRERICLDGQPISVEGFLAAYDDVAPYVAMVDDRSPARLSFFEVLTAMAFAAFADAPVDVAVIEVGLGGTWDATNVADGAVAVITPVSIDHTAYLGDTVTSIAGEKAGIIKPGSVAVLGRQLPAAAEVLLRRAADVGASVAAEGEDFGVAARELAVGGQQLSLAGLSSTYDDVFLPLFGAHQASNAACALAAVEAFSGAGAGAGGGAAPADWPSSVAASLILPETPEEPGTDRDATSAAHRTPAGPPLLDPELVREAFAGVTAPGRLEVVRRSPVVVVDSAHNPAGMAVSMEAVAESFAFGTLAAVLAVSADKDVPAILAVMEPAVSQLVATQNSSPRCLPWAQLAELATAVFGADRVHAAGRLDEAIDAAVRLADEAGLGQAPLSSGVLVTGSVVTAGDARLLLGAQATAGPMP